MVYSSTRPHNKSEESASKPHAPDRGERCDVFWKRIGETFCDAIADARDNLDPRGLVPARGLRGSRRRQGEALRAGPAPRERPRRRHGRAVAEGPAAHPTGTEEERPRPVGYLRREERRPRVRRPEGPAQGGQDQRLRLLPGPPELRPPR